MNVKFYVKKSYLLMAFLLFLGSYQLYSQHKDAEQKKKYSFKDSVDGAFDISDFLISPEGFMPVPIIITEPAIGYGGGMAALFLQQQKKKYNVHVPPNISGIGGFGTSNKTWGIGAFHFHVFGPDKVRTLSIVAKPDINIDYYGNNNEYLSENPVEFNLSSWLVAQRVNVRVKTSNLFVGGAYMFFRGTTTFDPIDNKPIISDLLSKLDGTTTMSMLKPMINLDSRNNIFTPTKGMNTGLIFTYNATWLGADDNYYLINPYFLGYKPLSKKVFSGFRMDSQFLLGDAPFYAEPYIQMRGVPALKYQSNNTILVDTQFNFKVYKRWSIDTFVGTGKAFKSFETFGSAIWVYSYGFGFRYEIASLFGIDAGMDFAWSNDGDFGFSIVFGSAWNK
jgi:hypothetical protein